MLRLLRLKLLVLTLASSVVVTAAADSHATKKVVVTLPLFGFVVAQIVPDADVTALVEDHEDAHHAALTPKERFALSRADLIVRAGTIEEAMDRVLSAPSLKDKVLRLDLLIGKEKGWSEALSDAPAQQHFWFDPSLMPYVVKAIADRLGVAEAQSIKDDFAALDTQIAAMLAPFAGRDVITLHDGLGRFIDRYGLQGLAAEAHEHEAGMSAADMAHLRHELEDHPGACVVAAYDTSDAVLATLLDGTSAQAMRFDFIGGRYDSYRNMMLALAGGLVDCFGAVSP